MKDKHDRWKSYLDKGSSAEKKKDYKKAISCYTRMIEVEPSDGWGYRIRADVYVEKGDYGKAIADYTKAIRLNYHKDLARRYRADAYQKNGEYDKAIADYTWVIRNDPNDSSVYILYLFRARAYVKKHDYIHALNDATKAQKLGIKVDSKSLIKLRSKAEKQRQQQQSTVTGHNHTST